MVRFAFSPRERQAERFHSDFPLLLPNFPKPAGAVWANLFALCPSSLMTRLLSEAFLIGLFGVALGLHVWTFPVVCGLAVALAVIAAQAPVRIVRAIQPTVVLKGE